MLSPHCERGSFRQAVSSTAEGQASCTASLGSASVFGMCSLCCSLERNIRTSTMSCRASLDGTELVTFAI